MRYGAIALIGAVLLSGCGTKAKIHTLEPAQVDLASKQISLEAFAGDRSGFSSSLKRALLGVTYEGRPYFTVLTHGGTRIGGDVHYQLDEEHYVNQRITFFDKNGKYLRQERKEHLSPHRGYHKGHHHSHDKEDKKQDKEWKDEGYQEVDYEFCTHGEMQFYGEIESIRGGSIVDSMPFDERKRISNCDGYDYPHVDVDGLIQDAQEEVIATYVSRITPQYRSYEVALIEEGEKWYTKAQVATLEDALKAVDAGAYHIAEEKLQRLVDETRGQSKIALYNLAVVQEANKKFDEAKANYAISGIAKTRKKEGSGASMSRVERTKSLEAAALRQINR